MIISYIMGGIGNQLFQYAAGLRLARKHKTQLKLDTTFYALDNLRSYALDQFNITATVATPDEIQCAKKILERAGDDFMPEVLDCPDDVWLYGYWQHEEYFADVADELRREFTLRQPLGATAQRWREKISAAQCSVSVHVRHGDFIYNPINATFAVLPLKYYRDCIDRLKREHSNIKLFVFSDDLNWCRENFRFGVPIEFVTGDGLTDLDEFRLMSSCQHNVIANSTFSRWAAWLNHNPNKKVFAPIPTTDANFPPNITDSPLDSDKWIRVPFDADKLPAVNIRPYFSLLMVVNDDSATLRESLETVLAQDYKYYELIIVDNASTDGSRELCQNVAAHENVTLIKLFERVQDGAAWNIALDAAQGKFVMFLRGDDRIFANALTYLYMINEHTIADVVNSTSWFREDSRGTIAGADRKFVAETDALLSNVTEIFRGKFDKPTILKLLASTVAPVGTKVFKRKFLSDNAIKFDEKLNDVDSDLFFMVEAMFKADEMIFTPEKFFIAQCNK